MRMTMALPFLIGALSLGFVAGPASAQKANKNREAAIKTCVDAITKEVGLGEGGQARRIAAWKSCMARQGQRP